MHLADGPFSSSTAGQELLAAGWTLSAGGILYGLSRLTEENIPRAAVLASAFFVSSLIHLPIGPTSIHPVLAGLMGLVLGWGAFPGMFAGLLLQAVFFQHGGITTLGLNTFNMAGLAVLSYLLFGGAVNRCAGRRTVLALGFAAGALPILLASGLIMAELLTVGEEFRHVAAFAYLNLPLALGEGLLTMFAVSFLKTVKPELLQPAVSLEGKA